MQKLIKVTTLSVTNTKPFRVKFTDTYGNKVDFTDCPSHVVSRESGYKRPVDQVASILAYNDIEIWATGIAKGYQWIVVSIDADLSNLDFPTVKPLETWDCFSARTWGPRWLCNKSPFYKWLGRHDCPPDNFIEAIALFWGKSKDDLAGYFKPKEMKVLRACFDVFWSHKLKR